MKMCPFEGFWLFRDNMDGWQPTLEFRPDGFSKPTSVYYSNMFNRATRIEVYYYRTTSKSPTQQQAA